MLFSTKQKCCQLLSRIFRLNNLCFADHLSQHTFWQPFGNLLVQFLDPKLFFQSTIHGLWLMTDFPKLFLSVHHIWIVNKGDSCYLLIMIFTHCLNLIGNLTFYNQFATEFIPKNYLDYSVGFLSASILL